MTIEDILSGGHKRKKNRGPRRERTKGVELTTHRFRENDEDTDDES